MKRLTVAIAVASLLMLGAMPAVAQPSPVDEVAPIVIERPPVRTAVPVTTEPAPAQVVPAQVVPVRAAGVGQLARTGIDAPMAAGIAGILFVLGGAALVGARQKRRAVLA